MNNTYHNRYMLRALRLAEQGRFSVSPNPMVGCVVVKKKRIIGQGYHQRAGESHAEIFALNEAGIHAQGATVYVTLEPCCHFGRTPPCTNALISAGVKKVFVSVLDPNPLVGGKGVETLRAAGIEVHVGLCAKEASALNEIFFHYITHKRPFVIAKWAMSLDGKTIVNAFDDKQISCHESQSHTHELRSQFDAILVGAQTAQLDNPQLTSRFASNKNSSEKNNKQPLRIVVAGRQSLPENLKLFNGELTGKTILATTKRNQHFFTSLNPKNVEVLVLPENKSQQVSLPALLDELGKRQISSIFVEGGMTIHESFFKENLVNKIHVYVAPVFIGSLNKKQKINHLNFFQIGKDFHFVANIGEKIQNV